MNALNETITWVRDHVGDSSDWRGIALADILQQWMDEEKEAGSMYRSATTLDALLYQWEPAGPSIEPEGTAPKPVQQDRPFLVRLSATAFFEVEVRGSSLQEARALALEALLAGQAEQLNDVPVTNVKVLDVTEGIPA